VPTTKQRRETARRRLERQIQRRQEAATKRRRRNLVTAAAFGVLLVLGGVFLLVTRLGGDDSPPAAQPSASASPALGDCAYAKGQEKAAKDVGLPPNGKVPTSGTVAVSVATSRGPMTFALDRAKAPCTVANFAYLAGKKYYDRTSCHRVTTSPNFGVLQCGDPTGTGGGGPGYTFGDELKPDTKYSKGVLAMANSGPNTNGSQFFIVYRDTQLDPNYTVFGMVTKGLPVAEAVAKGGVAPGGQSATDGKPKLPITLTSVRVAANQQ
jgi:peptidyl-prolyl cis-trans isomerase B (cyclophilin B)